jgi:uncharacterized 2Fe-2S/4Fe-4S cluster protein (DUF4445 family)
MKYTVHFQPNDVVISVDEGTNLLDAALAADVHIDASCGGQGACGNCRVKVSRGKVASDDTKQISQEEWDEGFRLACCSAIVSDCTIEIPLETKPPQGKVPQTVEMGKIERRAGDLEPFPIAEGKPLSPVALKLPLRLSPPTMKDNLSDWTRLSGGLKQQHHVMNVSTDVGCIKAMPRLLRDNDWQVTVTLLADPCRVKPLSGEDDDPWRLVRLEAGNTSKAHFGIALDVGTTTVCGELIDLNTGRILAETALYNGQIKYGADVITRIVFAQKNAGAQTLQDAVVSTVNQVIAALVDEATCTKSSISSLITAGNTTMTHLLLGMETRFIREAPYVPAVSSTLMEEATQVGIDLPGCARFCTFPAVASYVGGDIVSGILGSGMFQSDALTLYMDIGTNGEIVLGNRDWLACAACSMGPAFEGGGIKNGMRADIGAIEGVHINARTHEPMFVTIGREKPVGICGSGLISALSELLSSGIIDPNGKFKSGSTSERIREGRFGHEYVLAWAEHSGTGKDIVITEVDIDNLIRAKGALFAGCLTLLDSLSLSFDDLERVIIAGAFGRYINLEKGQRIGLFPDLSIDKFYFLGNGSLIGARLVSLDRKLFREVRRISTMMTNVELSDNASFMDKYMAALFLPHTDGRLFPNVCKVMENVHRGNR